MTTKSVDKSWVNRTWSNQKLTGSFSSLSGFLRSRKKWSERKNVEDALRQLYSYSVHKPIRKTFKRRRIIVNFEGELFSSDLKDVSKYKKDNDNVTFLLIVIDAFSKKAYVRALKNKTAESVLKGMKSIFRQAKRLPVLLLVDMGVEYINKLMKKYLKENGIKLYHVQSEKKSMFSERFIRTLWTKIQRYLTQHEDRKTKKNRYIDKLQQFVETYNNTPQARMKLSPNSITRDNANEVYMRLYGKYIEDLKKPRKPPRYHVGQKMRISRQKLVFTKG